MLARVLIIMKSGILKNTIILIPVKYIFYDERGIPTHVKKDTIMGLSRVYDYSYALSASTNIYGMFIPRNLEFKN